jgi:hypothetical protein
MGLLTPLYLAGLAALSLPILFHLIRRTPRGRQAFSSLMFLTPSPPRLTRRSRLDHLLLLLLRAAVLALLALAFARPFLREATMLPLSDSPARRVAILLDQSASMRRGDLWQQATREVEEVLADLGRNDDVALVTFGERVETIIDFDRPEGPATENKADLVRQRLKSLAPTWGATDLGAALIAVANELEVATDTPDTAAEPHLVLISDLQRGSRTEALQSFAWPERVRVVAHRLSPKRTSNAVAQLLVDEETSESSEPRVRIVNAADSNLDQFFIRWSGGRETASSGNDDRMAAHVPAGQSRVLRLPRSSENLRADRLLLEGDEEPFDNTFYVVPPRQQAIEVVYVGSEEADDAKGLRYYLELALSSDPLRKVEMKTQQANQADLVPDGERPEMIVVTEAVSPAGHEELSTYVRRGGYLLLAPKDQQAAESAVAFFDDLKLAPTTELKADHYLLLGELDFSHPLFVLFANPRYSDFTKIHFWRYRALELAEPAKTRVLARFDNRAPALVERTDGDGRMLLLASGWHPDDSQLALSSKFVPLVQTMLEQACGGPATAVSVVVHEPVALPLADTASAREVQKPDGTRVKLAADAATFADTDEPGLYQLQAGATVQQFAVNLLAAESNTAPLALEQLEQLGVRFGTELTRAERIDRQRQQRDTELESRQKVWRWLIIAALVIVILETLLAGRAARQATATLEMVS